MLGREIPDFQAHKERLGLVVCRRLQPARVGLLDVQGPHAELVARLSVAELDVDGERRDKARAQRIGEVRLLRVDRRR